jgi:hypothetical protein
MEQVQTKDMNVDHLVDLTTYHHHFSHLAFDHFQELEKILEPTKRKNILGKLANHKH